MPSMVDQHDFLATARNVACGFAQEASRRGWRPDELTALETAVAAIWKARSVLLASADHPYKRQRRARVAPPTPVAACYTGPEAAASLGLRPNTFASRAKRLGVGVKIDGKFRYNDQDLDAIAGIGRM